MSIKLSTLAPFVVPGQPTNFQVGEVSDTSVELTWEPAFEKEGIISYELHYREGGQESQVPSSQIFSDMLSGPLLHVISSNVIIFGQTGKENIRPNLFICGGGSTCKYRVLLLSGCRLQQRHWSLHQRNIPKDVPSQYVVHFLSWGPE